ncbi:hypothetical protein PROFUN_08860 [Planoprotostelium fungivorum]|uniref:Uncharacterized protein n=1 Tax=Planoprotostelium fungivorum TaxID=1890364 RepID=A0A2P6NIY0_9EUKA|nr:hypothetical protein PROFUN_08860 [Planoprotostelium fungivorum]
MTVRIEPVLPLTERRETPLGSSSLEELGSRGTVLWDNTGKSSSLSALVALAQKKRNKKKSHVLNEEDKYDQNGKLLPCWRDDFVEDDDGSGQYVQDSDSEDEIIVLDTPSHHRAPKSPIKHQMVRQKELPSSWISEVQHCPPVTPPLFNNLPPSVISSPTKAVVPVKRTPKKTVTLEEEEKMTKELIDTLSKEKRGMEDWIHNMTVEIGLQL